MPIGIAQITIFDAQQNPVTERLIFVNPHKKLNVEIKTDKEKYLPREKVKMDIVIKNEKGEPIEGNFSLAVCDDKLLSFADDKQGHILSNLLLESELKGEVVEPNFYFENKEKHREKDEKLALDLLMMTQGWRRVQLGEEKRELADLEFDSEETVLAGVVSDYWGNALDGVKLVFKDKIIYSDSLGNFEFKNMQKSDFHKTFYAFYKEVETRGRFLKFSKDYKLRFSQYAEIGSSSIYSISRTETLKDSRIIGNIVEYNSKAIIPFAQIAIEKKGMKTQLAESNLDGKFEFNNLISGNYKLTTYFLGYQQLEIQNLELSKGETIELKIELADNGRILDAIVVRAEGVRREKKSLAYSSQMRPKIYDEKEEKNIARKKKKEGKILLKEINRNENDFIKTIEAGNANLPLKENLIVDQIKNIPTRSVNALAATAAGVKLGETGELKFRGSRSNVTQYPFDGIRIKGKETTEKDILIRGNSSNPNAPQPRVCKKK